MTKLDELSTCHVSSNLTPITKVSKGGHNDSEFQEHGNHVKPFFFIIQCM
jgi:hypothetical protein